jgi:hypothetical protein
MEMGGDYLENLGKILARHFAHTPAMQLQDLYKLLHQAALGSTHAVRDERVARDSLERELACMGAGPVDPLIDTISPEGEILRIHLRPFMKLGKDPKKLLQAFVQTANHWQGSHERLKEYGLKAAQLAKVGSIPMQVEAVQSYFENMQAQGYPAMHHSETYQHLYHPAYRVVAKQYLEEI